MQLKDWNLVVSTASDFSDLLPLMFLLSVSEKSLKILRIYFLVSATIKLTTIVLIFGFGIRNTHLFYHILAIFEFTMLFFYYKQSMSFGIRPVYLILLPVIAFDVINSFHKQNITVFNSHAWAVNTFALMVIAFLYLHALYSRLEDISLETHSGFIINAGLLVYFGGSLFTYLFASKILTLESKDQSALFDNGWIIPAIANIFKNCIIAYGITRSNSRQ